MKDKVLSVTVIPTRKCNLKCGYCLITRPEKDLNELSPQEWFEHIKKNQDTFHFSFYTILGGDISMWPEDDIVEFTRKMRENNIYWSYTTNAVKLNRKLLIRLKEAGIYNISLSLDTLNIRGDKYETAKSKSTLKAIDMINELGIEDTHVTLTFDRTNLTEVIGLVKYLSERGAWAEITPVIYGKSKAYDYGTHKDNMPDRLFTEEDVPMIKSIMEELVQMKKDGFLIHNTDQYLLGWKDWVVKQDWKCNYPCSMVTDADGSMRLCLHIKGDKVTRHNFSNLNFDEFLKDWKEDYNNLCEGCYWNCSQEAQHIYEHTNDQTKVDQYFSHHVKDAGF